MRTCARARPGAGSPPSSYAAYDVARGKPGALLRFAALTGMRSFLIAPGLSVAGVDRDRILKGSFYASLVISGFTLFTSVSQVRQERRLRRRSCA